MASTVLLATSYASIFKVCFVLGSFVLWCLCIQWVDCDAERVKTVRERWNIMCLTAGMVAIACWLVFPLNSLALFFLGWGIYVVIASSAILWYVAHRNKRVGEKHKVLTSQHFKRLLSAGRDKKDRTEREYRVRLFDHENKTVAQPEEPEEAEQFNVTQDLLHDALWRRATEIELSAVGGESKLIYCIDGVLTERKDLVDPDQAAGTIDYLKRTAGLDAEQKRRPQRGSIRAGALAGSEPAQIEVHCSGSRAGERMQLRMVGNNTELALNELGLHAQRLEKLQAVLQEESGLVIVCGPPRNGITTTLYSIVRAHDAYIQNIHSLEKQPLFEVDNITQHQFDSTNNEVSYGRRLQSVLRREPDVVLVGEMDDEETAQVCIKSAAEGKKIYAGMTSRDALDALDNFVTLAGSRKAVARVLKAVVSQQLVRTLCPTCKEAYKPDEKLLKKANLPVHKIEHFYRPPTEVQYDKHGREIICPNCQGTGYKGRTGIFEILIIDDAVAGLIESGAALSQVKAQARKNKMYYLQEEGLLKTMDGVTSINEILRAQRSSNTRR